MNEGIVIALIGCTGSVIGSLFGVLASNKLTTYRIEQLEKKVMLHNNAIERLYKLEEHNSVQDERIKFLEERVG